MIKVHYMHVWKTNNETLHSVQLTYGNKNENKRNLLFHLF
jgi:hypothetical protein